MGLATSSLSGSVRAGALAGLRRKLMKRVGAFVASSFGILGIDLLAGALPHTLSAVARESLRFLSRNIFNSRATGEEPEAGLLLPSSQVTLQPGATHIQAAQTGDNSRTQAYLRETPARVRGHVVSKGGRQCSWGP